MVNVALLAPYNQPSSLLYASLNGKFGIDLALGSVIDKKATKDDYKFLPDFIFYGFENATIKNNGEIKPLVKKTTTVLNAQKLNPIKPLAFSMIRFMIVIPKPLPPDSRDLERSNLWKY